MSKLSETIGGGNVADMTRDVALEIVEDSWSRLVNGAYSEDELSEAHGFAISDMKRVEELEAENKRLKEGIKMVKAGIDNSRTISLTHNTALDECLSIINEYLGE